VIRRAEPADMDAVRELFREYAVSVGECGCFQAFDLEVAGLPGPYFLLVAVESGETMGCAGLRRIAEGIGEMKRLYVRPGAQGRGIGRALAERMLAEARELGYHTLRLDTLRSMDRALALYRALGFRRIPPYGDHPKEAICFELPL
jgi:ribosomal protein S18 acetylase RimI-like enzyme